MAENKKTHTHSHIVQQEHMAKKSFDKILDLIAAVTVVFVQYNMCANVQGSTLEDGVNIWTFER